VVVASRAEGFGLPIIEALRAGAAVLASALPVFVEVGGDAVRYFPPGDVTALSAALADLARTTPDSASRPSPSPTWEAATRALLAPLAAGQ